MEALIFLVCVLVGVPLGHLVARVLGLSVASRH